MTEVKENKRKGFLTDKVGALRFRRRSGTLRHARNQLKRHPAILTYHNGEKPHTVGINRIQIQQKARGKGNGFKTRAIIQVMDPEYSRYRNLSDWDLKRGTVRVAISD